MKKKRFEMLFDEKLYSQILEYQTKNGISSTSQTITILIESQLSEDKDPILKRLDELEDRVNEGSKASYACLNVLSFLYRDFCALASQKLGSKDKRFVYWGNKSAKAVFKFFKSAGNACISTQRIHFWKSYKFACSEPEVKDGDSEQLLGINEADFAREVTNINDATAIRTKKLDK